MTPPRTPDTVDGSGKTPDEVYAEAIADLARLQGVINVAHGEMVEVIRRANDAGVAADDNLPATKWVAWRTGVSPKRAHDMVKLATRSDELPHTIAALQAGELTVDQAAEVARYVPARYEESAAQVAQVCTVKQLQQALPWYRDPKPSDGGDDDERRHISTGTDDQSWRIGGRLPESQGAIVDQAINAKLEDLRRQAKADAKAASELTGTKVDPVPVTAADALVAMAEDSLNAGEAARPGTDRYLVHAHLQNGPNGIELATHLGIPLPDGQRRQILCDARLRGIVHEGVTPVGVGRSTYVINRRLRRAIEHRDGGCSVPGCSCTTGLEIHHIWHWEDGGPTETWNLITLCKYHHTCHHNGTLDITGNADHPRHRAPGVVFTNKWGHQLDPVGQPIRPATKYDPRATPVERVNNAAADIGLKPHVYEPPTGERLDRWGFHLQEDLNHPTTKGWGDSAAHQYEPPQNQPPEDDPEPSGTTEASNPRAASSGPPTGPDGPETTDPTRAGPQH